MGGQFRINTLVKDPFWDGPLFVLCYVGANGTEMVAECVDFWEVNHLILAGVQL